MKKIKLRITREEEVLISGRGNEECHIKCSHKDVNFEGYCLLFNSFLFYTDDKKGRFRCKECIESEVINGSDSI